MVDDSAVFLQEHPATYEMITLNDVLEHVPKQQTVGFLKAALGALRPRGNLVINVRQAYGFTSLFTGYNDFTHETLFTEMSLRQVLSFAGVSNIRLIRQKWRLK